MLTAGCQYMDELEVRSFVVRVALEKAPQVPGSIGDLTFRPCLLRDRSAGVKIGAASFVPQGDSPIVVGVLFKEISRIF